jgi:uncharacterized protein YciI
MYIVHLNYTCPAEVDTHLEAHRAWLDRHYACAAFLASGPKTPRTGGVILVRAMLRSQLNALLAQDPFAQAGVADYEVVEFTPNKQHPTLAATGLLDTPLT